MYLVRKSLRIKIGKKDWSLIPSLDFSKTDLSYSHTDNIYDDLCELIILSHKYHGEQMIKLQNISHHLIKTALTYIGKSLTILNFP